MATRTPARAQPLQPVRYGYYAGFSRNGEQLGFDTIVRRDFATGTSTHHAFAEGDMPAEPVFVPRAMDAAEGDGYPLTLVYRGQENRSDLVFFDATDLAAGPIACAELPHRIPFGFHGNWKHNS